MAAYCVDAPSVRLVAPLNVSVMVGPLPGVSTGSTSETARLCETDGAATLVAVIVTLEEPGSVAGAVKLPVCEMEPRAAFPPTTPSTLQVTAVSELPITIAA
jgi:hypothetical protein